LNNAMLNVNARITEPIPSPYRMNWPMAFIRLFTAKEPPITVRNMGRVQLSDAAP